MRSPVLGCPHRRWATKWWSGARVAPDHPFLRVPGDLLGVYCDAAATPGAG
jgi:hypothetical protein